MPVWELTYRIGVDCTNQDLDQDILVLRGDASCSSVTMDQSFTEPNVVRVRVDYPDWIGLPPQSHAILLRRAAEGVPNIAMTRPRTQVILPISDPQEGTTFRVGSQVSIDENGHVGNRGTPIGIVMSLDNERHEAVVAVLGSGGGTPPLQVSRLVPNSQGGFDVQQDEFPRLYMGTPMGRVDDMMHRVQDSIRAEEDTRIFSILDSIAQDPTIPQEPPKPRPVFKTRYQRIMDQFEK
jgi:hypothetical protein